MGEIARDLAAGEFSSWLRDTREALATEGTADVPCGACVACCTSSYFVHIGPGEGATLARVPAELRFPAPGLPRGNVVLGYDERGHCPMLVDGRCSIYEHRPLTCRSYDCRVFAAAGIAADRPLITRRARRWRFAHADERARESHAAVRAAAGFLREHADRFPSGTIPDDPARLAVLAVKVCEVFLEGEGAGEGRGEAGAPPEGAVVEAVLAAIEGNAGTPPPMGVR